MSLTGSEIRRGRILFLHPSDEAYGADRMLLQDVTGLQRRGWDCRVALADDSGPGWLSEQLGAAGIPYVRLPLAPARRQYLRPMRLPAYVRDLLRARQQVRREVRRFRPQIIHVNTSALLVGALLGRPTGAILVWHVHEIVVRPRLAGWAFRLVPVVASHLTIAISGAVARHLARGLPRRWGARVLVVANGIPDRQPIPPPQGPVRVLYAGRLNRWKGYQDFVGAAAMARSSRDAEFLIAGTAPDGERWREVALEAEIARRDLLPRLRWLGQVDDVPLLIEGVHVVVVPSRWPEPFGLVTLEAMRAGRAVIATDHGASPELLDHGNAGLLVAPEDPAAIAAALDRLTTDPAHRDALGSAGRAHFLRSYTLERHLDALEAAYASVRP